MTPARRRLSARLILIVGLIASLVGSPTASAQAAAPKFVQVNSAVPQGPQATVTVKFKSAQTAGNLNVVVVGWNDTTASVNTVVDSSGNTYTRAIGPTAGTGLTQSIYYAIPIVAAAANANTVTITFAQPANFADIRILEYSGIDALTPLDGSVGASGNSASSASGPLTTTNATDLLVGANMVATSTSGAGSGFTKRIITTPDGDLAEDRVVTAVGAYNATAPIGSGPWVMQMVAFRAAGSGPAPPPPGAPTSLSASAVSSAQISLGWAAPVDGGSVTGYRVERCQGAGCSNFAQIGTSTGTTYNDVGLPASTSFTFRVRADGPGGPGGYSNTATASTQAATPPAAPTNLTATAASSSQINLSWAASSGGGAVTGYRVERCQGAGCSNFAQVGTPTSTTFADSGLLASTSYSYQVRANGPGGLSGYSNVASATTPAPPPPSSTPTSVQVNSAVPQSAQSTVTVKFNAAQTAGNLNVIVVGWNDNTATVNTVSDTSGNVYTLAVGPTAGAGLTQSIYYAIPIAAAAAGANTVTVGFSAPASYADVRILEYSGIDQAFPLDGKVAASGNSASSNSSALTTTNPNNMLFGANMVATGTSGAGAGFTTRIITNPDGDIAEDRVVNAVGSYSATAQLSGSGPWVMQLVAFRAGNSPPPTPFPPIVSIVTPVDGATVLGNVTLDATATGFAPIVGVQFKVDASPIGAEDTTSPYTITWNSSGVTAGANHTLTAVARDLDGRTTTSAGVVVRVESVTAIGQWEAPVTLPIVAVHSILLPNGKVIMFDAQDSGMMARLWDLVSNTFTAVNPPINMFCAGLTSLADGRIFSAGGHAGSAHNGLNNTNFFEYLVPRWTTGPSMPSPRWYPTTTTLGDGRVLILAGESTCDQCNVLRPDIYDPSTNTLTPLSGAEKNFTYYPHTFVLPDGRLLVSSTAETPTVSQVLNLATRQWSPIGTSALDGGTAIMYQPGKILKTGTSTDPDQAVRNSVATSYVLDMNQSNPAWRQVPSMAFPRTYATSVMLPDGNVFVEGGGRTTAATNPAGAVYEAEIWSPTTETWTTVAPMTTPRLYHNTALLLPDGRVMVAGGGRFDPGTFPTDRFSAEFYNPPYLFRGPRPTITSAPSSLHYGDSFQVQTPDATQIASVTLIRLGSVTHAFDMAGHFVPLSFTAGTGVLNVQAAASGNLAPPGYYMLFIVNANGVPSVAPIIQLT
jgi:Galactose oxidase-like, Early set domain/Bacterial Ig domain/Fibronectin type III domain